MPDKLYIRADGNSRIATGHIMRCLSIASEVNRLSDIPVSFIISDEESRVLLAERINAFPQKVRVNSVVETDVPYDKPEGELRFLSELFADEPGGFLLADSYFIDNNYFSVLSGRVSLGFIDDIHAFDPKVDLLVNYIPPVPGQETPYHAPSRTLTGPDFAPVRREFTETAYEIRERASDILVSCGGMSNEWTEKILRALSDIPGVRPLPPTNLVAQEFASSDILVSAAGSTLYEAAAMGIPTVSVVTADNQIPNAEAFDRLGVIPYAGDLRQGQTAFDRLHEFVSVLTAPDSYEVRKQRNAGLKDLVDGQGARRIAEAIMKAGHFEFRSIL